MKKGFLTLLIFPLLLSVGCKKKATLTEDEQQLVHIMIDLQKVKAEAVDSVTFNTKRDSVLRKYNTTLEEFTNKSIALGDNHNHALMVYEAIKDSMKIK